MATAGHEVVVDGKTIRVTNLDKVLYPATGFTKGQVIEYYQRIAPVMLPHISARAVTLKRCPDGVEAEPFFSKNCPPHRPSWIRTVRVPASNARGEVNYCVANDTATLVWFANLAAIELHVCLAHVEDVRRPTSVVFDLDPGAPATLVECARVALRIREICRRMGLETVAKVSGSKGLHIYIPLNTPVTYAQTMPWAHSMAEVLVRQEPDLVISEMARSLRPGRVFVDWSQNDEHKTTVCAYSLRGKSEPSVSAPVRWEEIEAVAKGKKKELSFTPEETLARVAQDGDLFEGNVTLRQHLPDIGALVAA